MQSNIGIKLYTVLGVVVLGGVALYLAFQVDETKESVYDDAVVNVEEQAALQEDDVSPVDDREEPFFIHANGQRYVAVTEIEVSVEQSYAPGNDPDREYTIASIYHYRPVAEITERTVLDINQPPVELGFWVEPGQRQGHGAIVVELVRVNRSSDATDHSDNAAFRITEVDGEEFFAAPLFARGHRYLEPLTSDRGYTVFQVPEDLETVLILIGDPMEPDGYVTVDFQSETADIDFLKRVPSYENYFAVNRFADYATSEGTYAPFPGYDDTWMLLKRSTGGQTTYRLDEFTTHFRCGAVSTDATLQEDETIKIAIKKNSGSLAFIDAIDHLDGCAPD